MSQATPFVPSVDYSADVSPGDLGNALDADFDDLKLTTDELRANAALVQRDDGLPANATIHPDALTTASLALIASDWTPRGLWVTATLYAIGDVVEQGSASYVAAVQHISGTFSTDRASGNWVLLNNASGPHFAVATGTGDAMLVDLPITGLTDGYEFRTRAPGANTVTAPTINPTSLGAITITKHGGDTLIAGEYVTGSAITLRYRTSTNTFELLTVIPMSLLDATGAVARTQHGKNAEIVSVLDFGAVGDGVTDDTTAIQAAVDYAATVKAWVCITHSATNYMVTAIRLKPGMRGIVGPGTLEGTSATPEGVIETGPASGSGSAIDNIVITVNIAMGAARRGVFAPLLTNSRITGCNIVGTTTANVEGIRVYFNSENVIVSDNNVRLILDDPLGTVAAAVGIYVIALPSNNLDLGIESAGTPTYVTPQASRVVITGNYVYGGTHGIFNQGGWYVNITGNICERQSHRSIISVAGVHFSVVGNILINAESSGVHCSSGCKYFNINGNNIFSERASSTGSDDSAIQVYLHCTDFSITGNTIEGDWNYGFWGSHIARGSITGNQMSGLIATAGIALESEWVATASIPGGATYTKGRVKSYSVTLDTSDITIVGNHIRTRNTGAAIYLSQIGATRVMDKIHIGDNRCHSDSAHYVFFFEETSGFLGNITLLGFSATADKAKFSFTRGRLHFQLIDNCAALEDSMFINALTDGDTTPSVVTGPYLQCANTGATSITYFDDGVNGQEIIVRLDANTTIVHNNSLIRLKNGANITNASANDWVRFKRVSNIWIEVARAVSDLLGSATYDPASLADGAGATTTVTVTGAALGDYAEASFSLDLQGITLTAWVSAADTVSVRFQNESGGVLDLGSGTLRARVRKA